VNDSDPRTKVAILGGGVGGITAAFELTATPELRERFQVTVYQLGWRIGGKGASGRNASAGNRIEEHGLHVWFGFYDNAFRLMRDAYEELGRPRDAPLATVEDAFQGCDQLILYDRQGDGWHAFRFDCPRNFLRPGDPGELPTFWEMAATACRWALGAWRDLRDERPELDSIDAGSSFTPAWFIDVANDVADDLLRVELRGADHLLELAQRLAGARARHTDFAHAEQAGQTWFLVRLLTGFRDWLWTHVAAGRCDDDPDLRLFFTMFDTLASTVAGVVKDGVLQHGFEAVNDEEWAAWLRRHGAKEVTLGRTPAERSPLLRSVYDVAFGYVDGDISKADVAAGTATNDLLRLLFSYRGSLMYKMQAGMGDTVFTPLYEVLVRRGVRFEFFHAVTRLGLAGDRPRVDSIEVVPQVALADGGYDPLVDVEGLACWPSEPRWDQLVDGEALRTQGVNFELDLNPLGRPPVRLSRGADFDQVVLGIPVGALRPICGELIDRDERFRRAIESARTVQTQVFQLWVGKESDELGWEHDPNSVAGCYVEPLDTYCDMSHLIPRESWADRDGVRAIAYFCGVLPESGGEAAPGAGPDAAGETPSEATERAKSNAIEFLERDMHALWPAAGGAPPSASFDWSLLAAPEGHAGRARFDFQYWRANATASERYVLTTAGSVEHRLPSEESGFDNLVLAGDWTKNGIDGGCVEAAVVSGMQAARGLVGLERPISGEGSGWMLPKAQALSPYVEYGGRATSPGPFLSEGGRLRGFVLEGDQDRIGELVQRTLNAPAGRGNDYRALGSRVLLLMGGFDRVSSMTSPFDRWGTVREILASFWVPVVAGKDWGDVFVAERVGLAVPYIFVDNPMSYLGGRETYGYAKTMGRFEPAGGVGERMRVETFGGNFGRNEGAAWHPILEITPGDDRDGSGNGEALDGPADLVRHLAADPLQRSADGEVALPGMRLTATLVDDLLAGRLRQVFLKQFRDAADGGRACYQSVVETPIEVLRGGIRPSGREWDIKIHPLDSHPIEQEIGVASQRASVAFDGELDMVVKNGIEIGTVAASTGAPVWAERALLPATLPAHGVTAVIEGTARWIQRELSSLEARLRWW
jgi:uncharacterized protein with NAD-binding domain and iron-sulfur cluster